MIKARRSLLVLLVVAVGMIFSFCNRSKEHPVLSGSLTWWVTTGDQKMLLQPQPDITFQNAERSGPVIEIDSSRQFQTMDGFGFSLTGGSAYHIHQLTPEKRKALLKELFLPGPDGIGISYLRISIGASDLNDHAYTYDDLKKGEKDLNLTRFNLGPDEEHVIPVLKEILSINPAVRMMGSPWSAPAWMKSNSSLEGGSLKPEYDEVYADYLIKYLQAMTRAGINLDAITIQNEPENPNNNPSMVIEIGCANADPYIANSN